MNGVTAEFVAQLAGFVPAFATDILYDGPHRSDFARVLDSRDHTRVSAGSSDAANKFDCILAFLAPEDARHPSRTLQATGAALRNDGCGMLVGIPGSGAPPLEDLAQQLPDVGLTLYRNHGLSSAERPEELSGYIAFVVNAAYNPLLHARDLMQAGHWDWAFDVLINIPEELLREPNVSARVAAEKLVCLLAWDRAAGEKDRLARFFYSQATFYNAVAITPTAREVYLCHGEFWKRIGGYAMRQRLLRSVFHVAPVEEQQQIEAWDRRDEPASNDFVPPEWRAPERLPRVLFVMHPRPHYGLDVLYYGLCEVLGDENVVEYPHKPTLHGAKPEELAHYPCMFDREGTPQGFDAVLGQLAEGAFDLVVWGDIEGHVEAGAARTIMQAAGATPVVLFDAQDDPLDNWSRMNEFVGGGMRLHFKREMLTCWDYGAHTVPFPFAYADQRIPKTPNDVRRTPLFWAGHRSFGLRRLYLERIESRFGMDLSRSYTQDEYAAALADARIGLNIFGFGFDTVRYWEIPAHSAMLLAERLPIHVPHDFVDGESAIFFDDLPELEEKLEYWLGHPDDAAAIAARGHEHLMRYHTASARARQMLGWSQALLFDAKP